MADKLLSWALEQMETRAEPDPLDWALAQMGEPEPPRSNLSTFARSVGRGVTEMAGLAVQGAAMAGQRVARGVAETQASAERGLMESAGIRPPENWRPRSRAQDLAQTPMQDLPLFRAGGALAESGPSVTPEESQTFAGKAGRALGSGVGFVGTALVGRALGAPPLATTAGAGASVAGAAGYFDAKLSGADDETAWQSFTLNSLGGLTEAFPLAGIAGRMAKVFAKADKTSGGALREALLTVGKEAGQEFVQEAAQTAWGEAVAQGLLDYREDRPFLETVAQAAEAGAFGALSGGVLSGVSVAMQRAGSRSVDGNYRAGSPELPPTKAPQRAALTEADLDPAIGKELADAFPGARFQAPDAEADAETVSLLEQRGLRPVFVDGGPEGLDAAYLKSGTVALSTKLSAGERLAAVVDHELAHHAAEKQPEAAEQFEATLEKVRPQLLDIALEAYTNDRVAVAERAQGRSLEEAEVAAIRSSIAADEAYARLAEDFSPVVRALRNDPDALAKVRDVGFWRRILVAAQNVVRRLKGARSVPTAEEQETARWLASLKPGRTAESLTPGEALRVARAVGALLDSTVGGTAPPPNISNMRTPEEIAQLEADEKARGKAFRDRRAQDAEADVEIDAIAAREDESGLAPTGQTVEAELRDLRALVKRSGWATVGGEAIFDTEGSDRRIVDRTRWVPKEEWWNDRPGWMSEADAQRIVEKVARGDRLGSREQEGLDFLRSIIMREQDQYLGGEARPEQGDPGPVPFAVEQRRKGSEDVGAGPRYAVDAYHGTPHDFDRFSTDKIGTGEGAQAYGWGLYFAGRREVAEHYRKSLAERPFVSRAQDAYEKGDDREEAEANFMLQPWAPKERRLLDALKADGWLGFDYPHQAVKAIMGRDRDNFDASEETLKAARDLGTTFQVTLAPNDDEYLLWDKPLSEQSEKVKIALESLPNWPMRERWKQSKAWPHVIGRDLYEDIAPGPLRDATAARSASMALRAAGIRGIKYLDGSSRSKGEGAYNYVIFDEADVEVKAKYAVQQLGSNTALPDETTLQALQRKVQDSFNRARIAEKAVTGGASKDLDEAETLFRGKIAGQIAEQVEPLEKRVREALRSGGLDIAEVDRFLIARHARKRNEVIASRRPVAFAKAGKSGSGMSDAEADQVLADAKASGKLDRFEQVARLVDRARDRRLGILEGAGLITAEERKAWEETFGDTYVPLKTAYDPEGSLSPRGSRSFSVSGKETKRAEGRTTEAFSPTTQTFADLRESIVRAEKNAVMVELAKLVDAHPNPALWEAYSDRSKISQEDVAKQRVVTLKQGGAERYLVLRDDNLAAAVKGLNVEAAGRLMRTIGGMARVYAKLVTSWNPEFVLNNVLRDAQTAGIVLTAEQRGAMAKALRNVPAAARGAFRALRNPDAKGKWQDAFREMRLAGGATGFYDMKTLQERLDSFKPPARMGLEHLRKLGDLIDDANGAAEGATRLVAYQALRDQGVSARKAALVAKNLTTNFDRKGELGSAIGAMYLFFNANLQGNVRTLALVARNRKAQAVAAGLVGLGYTLALIADTMDPEDWENRTEFEKQRNLIFEPLNLKLPAAWGWNVFSYAGQQLYALQTGAKTGEVVGNLASATIQAANPLGGRDFMQAVTPWFLRPFQDVEENENFAGAPINPPENPFDKLDKPDSQRSFDRTSETAKQVAAFLNDVTGGDEWQRGAIDVGPGSIEYLTQQALGGVGSTLGRVIDVATKGADLARDVPFIRSVWSEPNPRVELRRMYDAIREVEKQRGQLQAGNANANRQVAALFGAAERYQKRAKQLREAGDEEALLKLAEQFNRIYEERTR